MRGRTAAGVVLALLFVAGCGVEGMLGGGELEQAEERLGFVLDTVSQIGTGDTVEFQTATCRFHSDKLVIRDQGEFELAYDGFREFLRKGGLAKGLEYEIEGGEEIEGSAGGDFLFSGTANGRPFEVIVPAKRPLRWQVAPSDGF